MLDINFIRQNPGVLDTALRNRNKEPIEAKLLSLDEKSRCLLTTLQKIQADRNANSAAFGKAKATGQDTSELQAIMEKLKKDMAELTEKSNAAKSEFLDLLCTIPNIPSLECPVGKDENANVEIRRFGTPKSFDFKPLEHYEIGTKLGMMEDRMDTYTRIKAADALGDAAKNEGNGGLAGLGIGLGTGTALGQMFAQNLASSPAHKVTPNQNTDGKVCTCGAVNSAKAKFCSECGTKLATKAYCSHCGSEVKKNSKFCSECGTKLN